MPHFPANSTLMFHPVGKVRPTPKARCSTSLPYTINLTNTPWPGCSKLTTSLVNVSLKFQMLISEICQYFLLKNVRSFCSAKASLIFSTKNVSVFGNKVLKHLPS